MRKDLEQLKACLDTGKTVLKCKRELSIPNPVITTFICDINNDGKVEVLVSSRDCSLCVINLQNQILWKFYTNDKIFGIYVKTLDKNKSPNIILASDDGHVYVLNNAGKIEWTYEALGWVSGVFADDIDRDGEIEIVAASDDRFVYALDSNGHLKWKYETSGKVKTVRVSDIDNDGNLETLAISYDRSIYVLDGYGKLKQIFALGGEAGRAFYLADIDADGSKEIITGAFDGYIWVYDNNGGIKWKYKTNGKVRSVYAVDVDKDGCLEIIACTEGGHFYILDAGGNLKWVENFKKKIFCLDISNHSYGNNPQIVLGINKKIYFYEFNYEKDLLSNIQKYFAIFNQLDPFQTLFDNESYRILSNIIRSNLYPELPKKEDLENLLGLYNNILSEGHGKIQTYLNVGKLYEKVGRLEKALLNLYKAYNMALEINDDMIKIETQSFTSKIEKKVLKLAHSSLKRDKIRAMRIFRDIAIARPQLAVENLANLALNDDKLVNLLARKTLIKLTDVIPEQIRPAVEILWKGTIDTKCDGALSILTRLTKHDPKTTFSLLLSFLSNETDATVVFRIVSILKLILLENFSNIFYYLKSILYSSKQPQLVLKTLLDSVRDEKNLCEVIALYHEVSTANSDNLIKQLQNFTGFFDRLPASINYKQEISLIYSIFFHIADVNSVKDIIRKKSEFDSYKNILNYDQILFQDILEELIEFDEVYRKLLPYLYIGTLYNKLEILTDILTSFTRFIEKLKLNSAYIEKNIFIDILSKWENILSIEIITLLSSFSNEIKSIKDIKTIKPFLELIVTRSSTFFPPSLVKIFLGEENIFKTLSKYTKVDALVDKVGYLVDILNMLDEFIKPLTLFASESIKIRMNELGSILRNIVSEEMSGLRGRANLVAELKTKEMLFFDKSITILLELSNKGQSSASEILATVKPSKEFLVKNRNNEIQFVEIINTEESISLEFELVPINNAASIRVEFEIIYSDAEMIGKQFQFADAIRLMKTTEKFVKVPNNYIVGKPIQERQMFFGREDIFSFISNNLNRSTQGNALIIHGQKRTGKTSILYQLQLKGLDNYIPIFVDMQQLALSVSGAASLFYAISGKICTALAGLGILIESPPFVDFKENASFLFERFLDTIETKIHQNRILLMIDEYEELQGQVLSGQIDKGFFKYLRNLIQHRRSMDFIFCGTHKLQEMIEDYWSELFNITVHKKISFLEVEDARRLIELPTQGYLTYDALALEKILKITHCHPYFIQLICSELINYLNEKRLNYVTLNSVNEVLQRITEEGSSYFIHVWKQSDIGEKVILTLLSKLLDYPGKQTATMQDLIELARNHTILYTEQQFGSALTKLVDRDVLLRKVDNTIKYKFTMEIVKSWLLKNKPIPILKEEI